jgi:hypothetical protein
MANPKRSTGGRQKVPTERVPSAVVVKGLSASDLAALDVITSRRRAAIAAQGGTTSRNAVIVSLLREAITRENSKGEAP